MMPLLISGMCGARFYPLDRRLSRTTEHERSDAAEYVAADIAGVDHALIDVRHQALLEVRRIDPVFFQLLMDRFQQNLLLGLQESNDFLQLVILQLSATGKPLAIRKGDSELL